jgi:uncharacterized protein (DUF433 family)
MGGIRQGQRQQSARIPLAAGRSREEILKLYPYLENEDISAALSYACWLSEAFDAELQPA